MILYNQITSSIPVDSFKKELTNAYSNVMHHQKSSNNNKSPSQQNTPPSSSGSHDATVQMNVATPKFEIIDDDNDDVKSASAAKQQQPNQQQQEQTAKPTPTISVPNAATINSNQHEQRATTASGGYNNQWSTVKGNGNKKYFPLFAQSKL